MLAWDLGNAGLITSPQNRLGLGNMLGTYEGGNLAAASVPELRIFSFTPQSVSGCCLCVFPL